MRLVTFRVDGRRGFGAVVDGPDGDGVVDLSAKLPGVSGVRELLAAGLDGARAVLAGAVEPDWGLHAVELLPPVPDPARICCIGLNYAAHRAETGRTPTEHPTVFVRFPSSLVGHRQPLVRPAVSASFDWEGELAVVIGRPGRHISEADAWDHVAGYSCFDDGSVRDYQAHTSQFTPGKNFDASGSFGPWLVTADEVPDPTALGLRTLVDGVVVQEATTDLLLFPIPRLIAYLSTFTTLEPGDVIATGTPAGVGWRRDPPHFLQPGNVVEVDISGVGRLVNPVVAEGVPDPVTTRPDERGVPMSEECR